MVRTTGKESVKLSKKLPNTIRKRLPRPNYQTYLTPHQFEALAHNEVFGDWVAIFNVERCKLG